MERYLFILLRAFGNTQMSEKYLTDTLLQICKRERKEYTEREAAERGFDIFDERDLKIEELFSYSLNKGYLAVVSFGFGDRTFIKTEKGDTFLQQQLTDQFSPEYLLYEDELNSMMDNHHLPRLERIAIMKSYWNKLSVHEAGSVYVKQSVFSEDSLAYHQYILSLLGISKPAQDLVHINLVPKLLVPLEYSDATVTLQLKGIELQDQLVITQPYRNKRYFVAGLKIGRVKTASGFYPLISESKEDLPETLSLEYHWNIKGRMKDEITIIHRLNLKFELTSPLGLFFSSVQKTSQSMRMNKFDLITYYDLSSRYWQERNVKIKTNFLNHIEIDENAILSNFPVELSSGFLGDRYFRSWNEKLNTSDKVM
ncbi:hypothetical protein [Paenibacillus sp. FSL P4-0288]|uniref:hypothetical protein n=1 Tax=Paenibacillus sp. FSL P4-0288 TaxID=2921633 RepID=UPI0030F5E715